MYLWKKQPVIFQLVMLVFHHIYIVPKVLDHPCQHVSHEKKKLLLSIESWLLNRDPYNGVWNNPHITVVVYSLYPDQPGALFSLLMWKSIFLTSTH